MLHHQTKQLSLFKGLSEEQVDQLDPFLDFCTLPQSTVIFEQGQNPTYLYILLEGLVDILYKPYDGPLLTISQLTHEDIFGWSAVMGGDAYTATAVAVIDSQAFRIHRDDLVGFCHKFPLTGRLFLENLACGIAKRIQSTQQEVLMILHDKMGI